MNIPTATYRLQFNAGFKFKDAEKLLGYLRELGVSHVYASPLMKARKGSVHGYDVTVPNEINPEIGSYSDFEAFIARLQSHQLALMLDIVPNHMAASVENPWWLDVLANGEASRYSSYFDIDWNAGSGKVLLPILQKPYGESLDSGELRVDGNSLVCNEQRLPLRAVNGIPGNVDELDHMISAQSYRVAYWRKSADAINYRRFFDVNDLVGVRAECDAVFNDTHAAILQFIERGWVQALRIDHIDGLKDPKSYLDRLPPVYVAVEKILGGSEKLPGNWQTQGTTGYDFLNIVNGAFVDAKGYEALCRIYNAFIDRKVAPASIARERKCQVMRQLFTAEVHRFTDELIRFAADHRVARDLTRAEISDAFVALTSSLPVYRTYIEDRCVPEIDAASIDHAMSAAGCRPSCNALSFVREVLLMRPPYYLADRGSDYFRFVQRWQQFTGAVMAKGLEDTTLYVFNPLISMNDVGSDSENPSAYVGVDQFHRRNLDRFARHASTMNATSTHDTKRSEDVRARIDVLSEMPLQWERCLKRWARWNAAEGAPDRNEQVFIYQTLLGAWPISRERMRDYMIKALREAKTHTSWLNINQAYEQTVLEFINRIADVERSRRFVNDFSRLHRKIAYFGMLNSLAQTLLKIASPGIPDFYQGTELWDYTLADPDNRRPVHFESRMEKFSALQRQADPAELLRNWTDGRIKMFVTWKALTFRREHADLFLHGDYIPLEVTGARSNNVIAFARRLEDRCVLVVTPRLCSQLTRPGKPPLGHDVWSDTAICVPPDCRAEFKNIFTGERISEFELSAMLSEFPVALLGPS